jgi:3-methylfumaryl-CoA hydratase
VGEAFDLDALRQWIGREERAADIVAPELVKRFRATFDQVSDGSPSTELAPLAIHWCLAPAAFNTAELGPDGHPHRGGFLPPVPLPRRMWAGGDLVLGPSPRIGDRVQRVSRIEDVTLKQGRSGPLCFVSVRHQFSVAGETTVVERQDLVYRGVETGRPAPAEAAGRTASETPWRRAIQPDPVLLFRYSALTFNGHRIHYDRRYCLEQEGYPGLVVHGPLQASLLLHFAAEIRGGASPRSFSFRSVAPIFDGAPFHLNALDEESALRLSTTDHGGRTAMTAEASW